MRKWGNWLYAKRFYVLVCTLLLGFFVPPVEGKTAFNLVYKLVSVTVMLLTSANFIQRKKKHLRAAWFLFGLLNIVLAIYLSFYPDEPALERSRDELLLLFFLVITVSLVQQIFAIPKVTADVILGSFCGFLLMGIISFLCFSILESLVPGSIGYQGHAAPIAPGKIFYFAFTCLTTVGFGDIVAKNLYAQQLAILTAVVGQFYIAVVVAILISRYIRHQPTEVP
ncbi:MAG: potassium channel protein [Sphingobacteriia bacterium]|nr:MAG: potassium channel protein [Sphingobacteriia bacterium]